MVVASPCQVQRRIAVVRLKVPKSPADSITPKIGACVRVSNYIEGALSLILIQKIVRLATVLVGKTTTVDALIWRLIQTVCRSRTLSDANPYDPLNSQDGGAKRQAPSARTIPHVLRLAAILLDSRLTDRVASHGPRRRARRPSVDRPDDVAAVGEDLHLV